MLFYFFKIIEKCLAFTFSNSRIEGTILEDYVFSDEDGYSQLYLGNAILYNHNANGSVSIKSSPYKSPNFSNSTHDIDEILVYALKDIVKGDELFISYGDKQWFDDRNIQLIDLKNDYTSMNSEENNLPGCARGVAEMINGKLYATQFISQGYVIEVSRGLIFPSSVTHNTSLEPFLWQSYNAELVMLLLGMGSFYQSRTDDEVANVMYDWYILNNFNDEMHTDERKMVYDNKMLISFIAARNIYPGEVLIIDLYHTDDNAMSRIPYFSDDYF
jgi:hypothetical protein